MSFFRLLPMAVLVLFFSSVAASPSGAEWQSFTPVSLKLPFVYLGINGTDEATFFMCSKFLPPPDTFELDPTDCQIDILDANQIKKAFEDYGALVPPGSYFRTDIGFCASGGDTYAHLKGTVVLGGVTWYTTENVEAAEPLTTDVKKYGYAQIELGECGSYGSSRVFNQIELADGDDVQLDLFANLNNVAYANDSTSRTGLSDCTRFAVHKVCLNPFQFFVVDHRKSVVTLETYLLTFDVTDEKGLKAVGQIDLLVDDENKVFGGTSRWYFGPLTPQIEEVFDKNNAYIVFTEPVVYFEKNKESDSFYLKTFSTGAGPIGMKSQGFIDISKFQRKDHVGNGKFLDQLKDYRAIKICCH